MGYTRDYGSGKGIFDLSISVDSGEVFGFLGPNQELLLFVKRIYIYKQNRDYLNVTLYFNCIKTWNPLYYW